MGCINPINVAPLVIYANYGTPQPLYSSLRVNNRDDDENDSVHRLWQTLEAEGNASKVMARHVEIRAIDQEKENEEVAHVQVLSECEDESAAKEAVAAAGQGLDVNKSEKIVNC